MGSGTIQNFYWRDKQIPPWEGCKRLRPVTHTELRAKVLREKSDGFLIFPPVSLEQIIHSLNKKTLALEIAGICLAMSFGSWIGKSGDGKNFGQNSFLINALMVATCLAK